MHPTLRPGVTTFCETRFPKKHLTLYTHVLLSFLPRPAETITKISSAQTRRLAPHRGARLCLGDDPSMIELALSEEDVVKLGVVARSRTEPASRVERARILLAYWEDRSFFAVAQAIGVHHQMDELRPANR